jgi:hypothetical protein
VQKKKDEIPNTTHSPLIPVTKCYRHPEHESSATCRLCKTECCEHCSSERLGICHRCGYKILMAFLAVMVVVSYAAWFGIL